jgi:hypothetical protein
MALDRFRAAADEARSRAGALGSAALDRLVRSEQDLNEALPVLAGLGFSVEALRVEMALIPVVRMTLVGSLNQLSSETLRTAVAENRDRQLLVTVLEALRTAVTLKERVPTITLPAAVIQISLSIPPSITVDFVRARSLLAAGLDNPLGIDPID